MSDAEKVLFGDKVYIPFKDAKGERAPLLNSGTHLFWVVSPFKQRDAEIQALHVCYTAESEIRLRLDLPGRAEDVLPPTDGEQEAEWTAEIETELAPGATLDLRVTCTGPAQIYGYLEGTAHA